MSPLLTLAVGLTLTLGLTSGESVLELTDSSFDSELESAGGTALVMFYAPWCGHCKKIKPEFEKAAKTLSANDPPVTLAKVDCTEAGKDVCGRFEVKGYPTLKIFRGGELSQDYSGPREAGGIIKYMKSQVGPSSKELKSDDDLKKFLGKSEVVVVGLLDDNSDRETFLKLADTLREAVQFGHAEKALGGRKSGIFLKRPDHLATKMEEQEVKFEGKVSKDSLKEWVNDNYHGMVGHRTLDNMKDFPSPLLVAFYDVDYVKNIKGSNYWRNRVMKVAKSYKGQKLNFAVSNKNDFMQELNEYGITGVSGDKPKVVIKTDGKKFVMEEEFSVESLEKFVKAFDNNELEAYIKSESLPESNDGPVKVAVARNFEELVTKSDNDVLIEFYAPWCGHCKKLTPIYDELGEKMSDESVSIVKMDATANDVDEAYDVRGFPTLYWLPKGSKKPVQYQGGRELDDFVKYIAEHASSELKSYDRKGKAKKTEL